MDLNAVRSPEHLAVERNNSETVGVLAEITLAKRGGKPISYFRIENNMTIVPILDDVVEMEREVAQFQSLL